LDGINTSPIATEHGLHARPYRREHLGARHADLLPDVWIDHPDTLFFEGHGPLVARNGDYAPLGASLAHVTRDQFTGLKGKRPLLHLSPRHAAALRADPAGADLTLAHDAIVRILGA
jgi:hypothetical protein